MSQPPDNAVRPTEICPRCGAAHVHPLEWHRLPHDRWVMALRCPDCEWRETEILGRREVERYETVMSEAQDRLADEIERVRREIMEDEVERFVAALADDLILPFDF